MNQGENMNETEQLYQILKKMREQAREEIAEAERQLSDGLSLQKSIVIKEIKGKRYYYYQWRENDRLHTQYLSPVAPGAVAEQEREIARRQELLAEKRKNIRLLAYADRMLKMVESDRKKDKLLPDYSFEVFWKDEITARVSTQGARVKVSRYTDHPLKQLFANKLMTRNQLNRILEFRCWERGRPDIRELLANLGLDEYNPYEIVRRTHGVSYNDYIWFRFPGEKLTSKDVLVR